MQPLKDSEGRIIAYLLGGDSRVSLRDLLRGGATDGEVEAAVRGALARKGPRHSMDRPEDRLVLLPMMGIGG